VDRNDPDFRALMAQLDGNPVAMGAVLPQLADIPAGKILATVRANLSKLTLDGQDEKMGPLSALRCFEMGLPEEVRPLLALAGLHEAYVEAGDLEAMAAQVDPGWTRQRVNQLLTALLAAGLIRNAGGGLHEIPPALTHYLRPRGTAAPEPCQRAFVDVMGKLATAVNRLPFEERRPVFRLHSINLHFALAIAERLSMDQAFIALADALTSYAQFTRNFSDVTRLYSKRAKETGGTP